MRVLALETTERIGGVALACDGKVLYELRLDPNKRCTQSLAPAITAALEQVGWLPNDVELVATAAGPGSFTGLRVGITTAKTFAYATRANILAVDTLEAIASAVPEDVENLSVAVDAQRGQVVAGAFRRGPDGRMHKASPSELVDVTAWLTGLPEDSFVTGPVLRRIADRLPSHISALDPRYWSPSAAAVAILAARLHAEGHRDDFWTLAPRYSRPSAAEEKWEKQRGLLE